MGWVWEDPVKKMNEKELYDNGKIVCPPAPRHHNPYPKDY